MSCYAVFDAPDEEYLCTDLSIGNSVLQQVESSKYLGDYLNSNLSWPQHIDYICNKIINLFFSIFYKIRSILTLDILKIIYYVFVHLFGL